MWCEYILFVLFLSRFLFSVYLFVWGINLMILYVILFIEWEIISVNSSSIVITVSLDWMSLIFTTFVLYISSIVIYYSGQCMSSHFYVNRLILLALTFVLSMVLLVISAHIISILLGCTILFSYLLSEYTIL